MNYKTDVKILAANMPTVEQIATLAAQIHTEAKANSKVDMAFKIWIAAQIEINTVNAIHNRLIKNGEYEKDRLMHEALVEFENSNLKDGMPLDDFLKALYPKSKPEDTMKWYRDYLRDNVTFSRERQGEPSLSESELQAIVAWIIQIDRENGVTPAYWSAVSFQKHRNATAQKTRSERGKKGAQKKHLEQKKEAKNSTSKTNRAPSKTNRAPSRKSAALTSQKRAASKQ